MAQTSAKDRAHHAAAERSSIPPAESFVNSSVNNGESLSITLNRAQWLHVVGACSIAAGQLAAERDFEQMFAYSGVCVSIGQRLGLSTTQGIGGDLPPPALARAAGA